ncbi:unnamed protein product [Arctogadus glacialis]
MNQWISRLTSEEREMLRDYFSGADVPDEGDPFPELGVSVDQTGLLKPMGLSKSRMELQLLSGKSIYKYCVVATHKHKLSNLRDTAARTAGEFPPQSHPAKYKYVAMAENIL